MYHQLRRNPSRNSPEGHDGSFEVHVGDSTPSRQGDTETRNNLEDPQQNIEQHVPENPTPSAAHIAECGLDTLPLESPSASNPSSSPSLEGMLKELELLLSSDDQFPLRPLERTLLTNVFREVTRWSVDQASPMTCTAQIALVHSRSGSDPTSYVDWGKKPCEISLVLHLHLLQQACDSGLISHKATDLLCRAIQETEELIAADKADSFAEQLVRLHSVSDYHVACYSIGDAVKFIKSMPEDDHYPAKQILSHVKTVLGFAKMGCIQDINQVIYMLLDCHEIFGGAQRAATLAVLGMAYACRFDHLRDSEDLDIAIERLQEATELVLLNDQDYELYRRALKYVRSVNLKMQEHDFDGPGEISAIHLFQDSLLSGEWLLNKIQLQPSLEVIFAKLSELLSLDIVLYALQDDRTMICRVHQEIKNWIDNQQSRMVWEAQIALAHSAVQGHDTTHYIDWNKNPAEISIVMYLQLIRRAGDSCPANETLQDAVYDTEKWLRLQRQFTSSAYAEKLAALQDVADRNVAHHSLMDAMKHIQRCIVQPDPSSRLSNILPRAQAASELLDSDDPPAWNRAVQAMTEFLTFLEGDDRMTYLPSHASALIRRFEHFGAKRDIDQAIKLFDEVLNHPADDDSRAQHLCASANAHRIRFIRFRNVNDIQLAISRFQEALPLTGEKGDTFLEGIRGLASSLWNRYMRLRDTQDIDNAIKLRQKATRLLPAGSEHRAIAMAELGECLLSRCETLKVVDGLESAIQWLKEACRSLPNSAPKKCNLGRALQFRFECFGDVTDIDDAIMHYKEAAEINQSGPVMYDLANGYACRFKHFGRIEDLDSAMEANESTLKTTPADHPELPIRLASLGNRLYDCFEQLKQEKYLDKALSYHQEAFNRTPPNSIERAAMATNLGTTFAIRYRQYQELKDLDQAIQLLNTASDIRKDSPDRYTPLHNLEQCFQWRYQQLKQAQDLESAIQAGSEAVRTKPGDMRVHFTLSRSYQLKYQHDKEPGSLDLAIHHCQTAVKIVPHDHMGQSKYLLQLGILLHTRYSLLEDRTPDSLDDRKAISAWKNSSSFAYGEPRWRLASARHWASVQHASQDLKSAAEGYTRAINLLPITVWIGLGATAQLTQITENNETIQHLACDATACMFSLAESEEDMRQYYLGLAVELLDQARSILWSQTSQLRHDLAKLHKKYSDLAIEFNEVSRKLTENTFDVQDLLELDARAYRRSVQKWEELVGRIRGKPGFESFLLPLSISELRKAAKEGPVIIINFSEYRCDALIIVYTGNLTLVPLSGDAAEDIRFAACLASTSTSSRDSEAALRAGQEAAMDPLQDVLHATWDVLGEPIIQQLRNLGFVGSERSQRSRVWWCLTGLFTFIPIHAAEPPCKDPSKSQPGMMDFIISSYTPTISALLRSQRDQSRHHHDLRLVAIGQSRSLPMVVKELEAIEKVVPADKLTILMDESATADSVSLHLKHCTWAHFACHGYQNHQAPMKSGLQMYDKILTLSELARVWVQSPDFAFLSCCQSATGSRKYTDESVHITAGLQFIGFRSVIGTLWSVKDYDARLVAEQVYEAFFNGKSTNPDSKEAAFLLDRAVRTLRDKHKVPIQQWVPFVHFGA